MIDPSPSLEDGPSKSQRKRESAALQVLGETLVGLGHDQLARIELPEHLRAAIDEARRISKFGALRRQLQYIGKLMRDVDPEPIRRQLDGLEGQSRAHSAWLHRLEHWRTRLISDDHALDEFVRLHPGIDVQPLRTLIRNARHEAAQSRPPRAFREIFRLLKALEPEPGQAHDEHLTEQTAPDHE
jgi:ribosome-associated protein